MADARRLGLKLLLDIVPNHCSSEHPWFREALAAGPGSAGPLPLPLRRRPRPGRGEAAQQLARHVRRPRLEPDHRARRHPGTVVPAPVHARAARPELAQPRGRRLLRAGAALLAGPRRRRLPHRRRRRPLQAPRTARLRRTRRPTSGPATRSTRWPGTSPRSTTCGAAGVRSARSTPPGTATSGCWSARCPCRPHASTPSTSAPTNCTRRSSSTCSARPWDAAAFRATITEAMRDIAGTGSTVTWVLNNHDQVRTVTRYAGEPGVEGSGLGAARARAAALLMLALPGAAYVYQGEELGLPEVLDLPDEVLTDPIFHRTGSRERIRDGCRVPLPWSGPRLPVRLQPGRGRRQAVAAAARVVRRARHRPRPGRHPLLLAPLPRRPPAAAQPAAARRRHPALAGRAAAGAGHRPRRRPGLRRQLRRRARSRPGPRHPAARQRPLPGRGAPRQHRRLVDGRRSRGLTPLSLATCSFRLVLSISHKGVTR